MPSVVKVIQATPTGPNGAASVVQQGGVPFPCRLVAYEIRYASGMPGSTVTKLYIVGASGESEKEEIFSITGNTNIGITDIVKIPIDIGDGTGGGSSASAWWVHPFAAGDFEVDVSLSDAITNGVTVTLYLEAH